VVKEKRSEGRNSGGKEGWRGREVVRAELDRGSGWAKEKDGERRN
jgi:hypothetical protein